MPSNRPKAPTFTTSMGALRYPKLSQIDLGTKEFPNPEGSYSANLILSVNDPAVQKLIADLTPMYEKALAKGSTLFNALPVATRKKLKDLTANPLYETVYDEAEEPTTDIIFKFKMKASGQYKTGKNQGRNWDSRVPVFDRFGNKLIPGFNFRLRDSDETLADVHPAIKPDIWGGTTAKVSAEIGLDKEGDAGYFIPGTGMAGLKLGLRAVQVFDVVSGGDRSAGDYGFSAEEREEADMPSDEGNSDF